jgi:hypothetical protein
MKFNSFLILLLFPSIVFCQGYASISGKVVDKNTQKGISHAYLSIPSKGFSSETNTLGEFKFFFPKINLNSTVIVSVIGYKKISKKASDFDSTNVIELEVAEQLPYVQGGDPKTNIKEAFANVKNTFPTYANYQSGYYIETVEMDKLGFVKVKEGIIRIERTHTQKNIDIEPEKIKLLKSRKYEWTEQTAKLNGWGFSNGAAIATRSLETSIPDYLDKGNINDYDFKIDSLMTYFSDSLVYSISFKPVSKRVKAGRSGKIYLTQNSQSIVRIEYQMTPEGIKDIFKGNIIDKTKIEGKSVSGYNQYLPMGGLWRLQDTKLVFEAKFEDKLEKKFTTEATLTLQFMANESLKMGNRSTIQLGEELLTTESFVRGGKLEESFWRISNYLIPTAAMLKIADKR